MRTRLVLILLCFSTAVSAQKLKKADKEILTNIQKHVAYLADDKLEGRRAGTKGEELAMQYIAEQFRATGLAPKGTQDYFQAFEINDGKQIGPETFLSINDHQLKAGTDFFPLAFSPDGRIDAMPAIALVEDDMPWFVDLGEIIKANSHNPHFDLVDYIRTNAKKAADKQATAIVLYNTSTVEDKLAFDPKDRSEATPIPVIYINKEVAKRFFSDPTNSFEFNLNVSIVARTRTGHNVVGYIDNGAPTTVILGAHFDHLGYGEDGNSMLRTGEKLIHNGADDNASGTAALMELGRLLKNSKAKKNNYLFVAFSGEELGLFGSKYFTQNPTIDLATANYMINMDMVGRLKDSTRALTIGGYGTSPQWAGVIQPEKKGYFAITIDSSGSGPSDHTSFYRKDIPVLFYFTGTHPDYHKPSDDFDKINYTGEVMIIQHIRQLVENLDKQGKLSFLKTREQQVSVTPFKVTLGIMPDYAFTGTGVRVDGVTDGRPAAKAGIKAGDIVTQLGDHVISDMQTYMKALNAFSKGQKTTVKFKRGNEDKTAEVEF
ncbi:M28 family peptidase [Nostoc ellipsosporum NOK]|nr:M28 family peptidase [Nostoc ellipsosporum NOK]